MERLTNPPGPSSDSAIERRPPNVGYWRRLRRLLVGMILIAAFAWPVAWGMARYLVVREPFRQPTHVLLLDAWDAPAAAADLCRGNPTLRVVSVQKLPARAMQLHVLPTFEEYARGRLQEHGIASDRYEVIAGAADSPADIARLLDHWFNRSPGAEVVGLSDYFAGRSWRATFDATMNPDHRRRIHVLATPRPDYDETNWWRSKAGCVDVLKRYLRLARLSHGTAP